MAKTILPTGSYAYNPAGQQVDFSNFTSVTGEAFDFTRLYAIIDVTAGQIIYTTSGTSSGYGGNFSSPSLFVTYDTTPYSGNTELQIIYDLKSAPTAIYDGTGTQPILSTTDSITGREGLDVNLLNSSFGGQLGWPLPSSTTSGYNAAISTGFINGGNLVAPNMDPMTNNLKVDIDSFSPTSTMNVNLVGSSITQGTSLDFWQGNTVGVITPIPFQSITPSASPQAYNQAPTDNNTLRVAANQYTSTGTNIDYGTGQITTNGTQRTTAPDFTVSSNLTTYTAGNNLLSSGPSSYLVDGYRFGAIQVISVGSTGSYIFEASNDNVTFFNIPVYNSLNPNALPVLGVISVTSGSVMYSVPISCRWLRVRVVSNITSNIQTFSRFSQISPPLIYSASALDYNPTTNPAADVLNTPIVASKYNQIEIDFNTAPSASLVTTTVTGSGSITQANGHSLFSTGTTITGSARAVSVGLITYRPANEIYSYFTAAFTIPSNGNSYQRIGMYDANNGFFIGYNGLNFGITRRTAGVDTFTIRTSWNGDLLDGSSSSKFTRNGIPEAINLTVSNLFRIRFAWLGSANILFDVFSPDGNWINFHNIRQPNSALNPSITVPNVPITLDVSKTSADATALIVATACWAGGTTSPYAPITATLTDNTLATVGRSVITGVTTGGGGGYVNVKVNPSGALVTDATVSSSVLPTGAATETTLSAINTKTPALGTALISGSTPVNIASDQIVPISLPDLYITGAAAQTASGNNALLASAGTGSLDVNGYRSGYVQVVSTATAGSYVFEMSADNVNWQTMVVINGANVNGTTISTSIGASASSLIYAFPILARFIRLRIITGLTGGSIQCFTRLSLAPYQPLLLPVGQSTASNLNVSASIAASQTLATVTTVTGVTTVSGVTSSNAAVPQAASDIASAAITSTTTSATFSPQQGVGLNIVIPVTAVSGTNPTMDIDVQFSDDTGTNWFTVYTFPRITATGVYRSPSLRFTGNRVRYIQTIGGTTPSFTRAISRLNRSDTCPILYQFIDRTIVPNTLNSTTPSFYCEGATDFNLIVRCTAQTTAATIALEFSLDGTNWFTSGTTVTTVAGIARASVTNEQWKFVRANVTTAGTGITLDSLTIKGIGL